MAICSAVTGSMYLSCIIAKPALNMAVALLGSKAAFESFFGTDVQLASHKSQKTVPQIRRMFIVPRYPRLGFDP